MRLFLILLTVISFGAFGSVSNVMLDESIANTGIETIRGSSVPIGRNKVMLPADFNNLLLNSSFEAQNATQGWTVTSLATATASTSDVFDGKKKVCLSGIGSIFQMLSDTDKYHGRKFIARFNIQNPQGREGRACIYDGEDLHKCVQIQKSDDFVEYVTGDTFIKGKSYGVIVNSLELDDICVDAVSVKLDPNEAYVAEIEGDWQAVRLTSSSQVNPTTDLDSLNKSLEKGNSTIFTLGNTGVKMVKSGDISISAYSDRDNPDVQLTVYLNGEVVGRGYIRGASTGVSIPLSFNYPLEAGDVITFASNSSSINVISISIYAKARSQVVVFPEDEISNEQVTFRFRTSAQSLENVGDFKIGNYSANTNTLTYSNTAPASQSLSSMSSDGVRVYPRAFNLASDHTAPSRIEIKVAKPNEMASCSVEGFDPANPQDSVVLDYKLIPSGTSETYTNARGLSYWSFNPKTGVLVLDAGFQTRLITNASFYKVADSGVTNSAFIKFKCSKLAQASAMRKPPRELVKIVEDGDNWAHIYSDGWVEQNVKTNNFTVPASSFAYSPFVALVIPCTTNKYLSTGTIWGDSSTSHSVHLATASDSDSKTASVIRARARNYATGDFLNAYVQFNIQCYGAASYLLENYGIKVNY